MANVDYDPQKAHEYYERTKKLKGRRRSTKGFSDKQKEQWAYAKYQLKEQQKSRDKASKESINAKKIAKIEALDEAKKRQKEMLQEAANAKVEALRTRLKNMSPEQKKAMKETIQGIIGDIREKTSVAKQKITDDATAKKKGVREKASADYKSAKAKSKDTYEAGMDSAYDTIKGAKK